MNLKKELNKMLIGYKIKHPIENIQEILIRHLIENNLYDYFKKEDNFFKINNLKDKDITKKNY